MASNILSIGQSALFAAQAQIATTGHNISNLQTRGYTRQVVQQASAGAQNLGIGFVGQGTAVNNVTRVFDGFLVKQILTAQTSQSSFDTYSKEISQIDNILGDSTAGLSPALADFFKGLQDLTANPDTSSSRQAVLSSSQILAARFQSLAATLTDSNNSVNAQITSNVQQINSFASQISKLNESISVAQNATGQQPNDLLDQRDQLVAELNKIVRVNTLPQDNGAINVFIGHGQPLVLGQSVSTLTATPSLDDPSKLQLGVSSFGQTIRLSDASITGGSLGGLLDYRNETLGVAQNTMGKIATVIASSLNAQNKLGLDQSGAPGGNFFSIAPPAVIGRTGNSGTAALTATITNPSQLSVSDYRMQLVGANFILTRLSDGTQTNLGAAGTFPHTVDGVTYSAPTMAAGDSFLIKPTANGAASLSVALASTSSIAAAAPITTSLASTNTGTGTISAGTVDSTFLTPTVTLPVTVTFGAGTPPTTFTLADGTSTAITGGITVNGVAVTSPVTFTAGATVSVGGMSFVIGGVPAATDKFTISANTNATKDGRNVQLMAALQTTNTIGNTTFQGAYSSLVSLIGNKTSEVQVLSKAEQARVDSVTAAQQSESGVNSDEELANMIRYQAAYQAGAKIIQAGSDLLQILFTLGG